jgi:3-hydroxyacyl-[acyl-carrier-protein] dehydratase
LSELKDDILNKMPYGKEFLFIDEITHINQKQIVGKFHFKKENSFYQSHLIDFPITPGVILIECMCQIGMVAHGIFLLENKIKQYLIKPILIHADSEFFNPVPPETTVRIVSEIIYFRKNFLRSKVFMYNDKNSERIASSKILVKFDLSE